MEHHHHVGFESLRGRLLVASPQLLDPNFLRTVILVLEHNDEGALGVVLNRPSKMELTESLGGWVRLAAEPAVVHVGGPVSPNAALALGRGPQEAAPGWQPLFDGFGTVDLNFDPDDLCPGVGALRVFAGYSGWGGGQLEEEMATSAWMVVDVAESDTASPEPARLWRAVLRRQGSALRVLASYPVHPSLN